MDRNKDRNECAVRRRARQLRHYHANAPALNYRRTRHALRARIKAKQATIKELEDAAKD